MTEMSGDVTDCLATARLDCMWISSRSTTELSSNEWKVLHSYL